MRQLVGLLKTKITGTANVLATRPSLSTDGIDITTWRSSIMGYPDAIVMFDASVAANIQAPTGGTEGVELWGYIGSAWYLLASLHDGNQINLAGPGQGFSQELHDLASCDRLAVAGTVSAGTVTYKFGPLERHTP